MSVLDIKVDQPIPCPACTTHLSLMARACKVCKQPFTWYLVIEPIGDPKLALLASKIVDNLAAYRVQNTSDVAESLQTEAIRRQVIGGDRLDGVVAELMGVNVPFRLEPEAVVVKDQTGRSSSMGGPTGAFIGRTLLLLFSLLAIPFLVTRWFRGPQTVEKTAANAPAVEAPKRKEVSFHQVKQATVMITTEYGQGTGFFVGKGGYILTNAHVVGGVFPGHTVRVDYFTGPDSKQRADAVVLRISDKYDFALIRCSDTCAAQAPFELGKSARTELGATIFTVGNPIGLDFSLTKGIISNTTRYFDDTLYFQTDASVNPGNSGGPAINENGEVIGVITAKVMDAEGIGFILPIDYATHGRKPILEEVLVSTVESSAEFAKMVETAQKNEAQRVKAENHTDPFLPTNLPINMNLEIINVKLEQIDTGSRLTFRYRTRTRFRFPDENRFEILVAAPERPVQTADLGQPEPVSSTTHKTEYTLGNYYDIVGQFPAGQLNYGDAVAIAWNGSSRSTTFYLKK